MPDEDQDWEYDVVVNDEEQYSIWAVQLACPSGWHMAGVRGSRDACLAHIEQVWTDMRPKSLRDHMAATAGTAAGVDGGPPR
jgi:MbtH protein